MSKDDDYKVGYKKPPEGTRFKPGRSGNPKGRPKGAKSFATVVMEELNTKITVRIGDKPVKMTMLQASLKRLTQKAVEGDRQSIKMLTDMCVMAELQQPVDEQQKDLPREDQQILKNFLERNKP